MFDKLMKAVVGTALLPVDLTYDIITGFGIVDEDDPATLKRLRDIMENLDRITDPYDEDW